MPARAAKEYAGRSAEHDRAAPDESRCAPGAATLLMISWQAATCEACPISHRPLRLVGCWRDRRYVWPIEGDVVEGGTPSMRLGLTQRASAGFKMDCLRRGREAWRCGSLAIVSHRDLARIPVDAGWPELPRSPTISARRYTPTFSGTFSGHWANQTHGDRCNRPPPGRAIARSHRPEGDRPPPSPPRRRHP